VSHWHLAALELLQLSKKKELKSKKTKTKEVKVKNQI
jgi:hypothetical protein